MTGESQLSYFRSCATEPMCEPLQLCFWTGSVKVAIATLSTRPRCDAWALAARPTHARRAPIPGV